MNFRSLDDKVSQVRKYLQLLKICDAAITDKVSMAKKKGALSLRSFEHLVTVLHICPEANSEFRNKVTSPTLREVFPGGKTLEVWEELVPSDKFKSITVESLQDNIVEVAGPKDRGWADYLKTRYGWDRGD